jgi:hypothetical protein
MIIGAKGVAWFQGGASSRKPLRTHWRVEERMKKLRATSQGGFAPRLKAQNHSERLL